MKNAAQHEILNLIVCQIKEEYQFTDPEQGTIYPYYCHTPIDQYS